jgi:hypothetical protein
MSHSDSSRKVATTMEPHTKEQLNKFAIREGVNLSEYVRRVLFNHVQDKMDKATGRNVAVKTGCITAPGEEAA